MEYSSQNSNRIDNKIVPINLPCIYFRPSYPFGIPSEILIYFQVQIKRFVIGVKILRQHAVGVHRIGLFISFAISWCLLYFTQTLLYCVH